ncbi:hypothetical protein [Paraburkholderia sp. LEh10]|nr:hypothetical protein [Paraburkholderia sp. LEh10]
MISPFALDERARLPNWRAVLPILIARARVTHADTIVPVLQ